MVVHYRFPSCVECQYPRGFDWSLVWLLPQTWIWLFLWLDVVSTGIVQWEYNIDSGLVPISLRMWYQGPFRSLVIVSGSRCFVLTAAWHGRQSFRVFWTWLLMLGNQSGPWRYCFVLINPWCPLCIAWTNLFRRPSSTTICCLPIIALSFTERSWKTCLLFTNCLPRCCGIYPFQMASLSIWVASSCWLSRWVFLLVTASDSVLAITLSLKSSIWMA